MPEQATWDRGGQPGAASWRSHVRPPRGSGWSNQQPARRGRYRTPPRNPAGRGTPKGRKRNGPDTGRAPRRASGRPPETKAATLPTNEGPNPAEVEPQPVPLNRNGHNDETGGPQRTLLSRAEFTAAEPIKPTQGPQPRCFERIVSILL